MCVLEAMAARLPLVSTRVGGIPEVAPEHDVAWYCPPGDVPAMADSLRAAASSADLRERGARGAEIVRARFGIDEMVRRYNELFREILGRRLASE